MTDIIVAVVLLGIICLAVAYIIRAKKRGTKCIGCPHAANCAKATECSCNSEK